MSQLRNYFYCDQTLASPESLVTQVPNYLTETNHARLTCTHCPRTFDHLTETSGTTCVNKMTVINTHDFLFRLPTGNSRYVCSLPPALPSVPFCLPFPLSTFHSSLLSPFLLLLLPLLSPLFHPLSPLFYSYFSSSTSRSLLTLPSSLTVK
ncbi:unnamed protein product [Schistocephalus solidus]|uniref:Uncharacterized protein n=1 Tax=Schistocephalus solidus TaxID=70667 RepID=A0A183S7R3_SCHSO|nr:unnamed protein product [Schistocephalus solidus]